MFGLPIDTVALTLVAGARGFETMFLANIIEISAGLFACAILAILLLTWNRRRADAKRILSDAQAQLEIAKREAETFKANAQLAAAQETAKLREQLENAFAARRLELADSEKRLAERESTINTQLDVMLKTEKVLRAETEALNLRAEQLEAERSELQRLTQRRKEQLATAARLTEAEARTQLMREVEQEAATDASSISRHIIEEAKSKADEKARQIISVAIQRYAGSHTSDITTATIALPGDELKGRIIGRDGRNIRAFEMATGVTVLIDDTPNAVVLSGFDPVRREIAREAMTQLIADGRIHPTRIEEVVANISQEMEANIMQLGENAVHEAGVSLPQAEVVKLLGKLHFRLSYSQNILKHSVEVAQLAGLLASELGLDVQTARRAGLLHDIGKAVTHEIEGPHALSGAEILRRYNEPETIINAVASHHNDVPAIGPWGVLVSAADAISASRPGARAESMSTYLKRFEDLEKIAMEHPGVDKCYAVQAGRELRVLVKPGQVKDEQAHLLARRIAQEIQEKLHYPGQIKVTIIRETRCVEVAK